MIPGQPGWRRYGHYVAVQGLIVSVGGRLCSEADDTNDTGDTNDKVFWPVSEFRLGKVGRCELMASPMRHSVSPLPIPIAAG
jgi:hypothetical protein